MGPPFPIPFRGKITANIYEISPGHLLLTSREIVFYCLTHWGPYSPFSHRTTQYFYWTHGELAPGIKGQPRCRSVGSNGHSGAIFHKRVATLLSFGCLWSCILP